jgi:hypothetical protein
MDKCGVARSTDTSSRIKAGKRFGLPLVAVNRIVVIGVGAPNRNLVLLAQTVCAPAVISAAKRLLARGQGDEYDFATSVS